MAKRETYSVTIEGVRRELPLFAVAPKVRIALFNLLGDSEIVAAAAHGLAERLRNIDAEALVTAETKSVPLIYHLAMLMGKPWVVLRKEYKPYMGEALSAETLSITTGKPQTLYLDEKDHALLRGKRVVLVDDVISTGSTLQGMKLVMEKVGAQVVVAAAVFTEGERAQWENIIALGHLPLFLGDGDK
jgi:adenine/guanine phosphoribosyltransferase-like PRPP-binding protein